jgi:hypothetical protein
MKTILLFLSLFVAQGSFAQQSALIAIPGTRCSMIPPAGFVPAANFSGFQNASIGASIMLSEVPAPYESLINGFTKEALLAKGMTLVSKQPAEFSQGKASMITVTQESGGTSYMKQMLVFGKNNTTIIVNGIYPQASKAVESEMKKALLSTVYDEKQNDDPLAAAIFTLDVTGTHFKFTKFISGSLLYTVDEKIPSNGPLLVAAPSFQNIPAASQKKYAQDRIKTLPRGEQSVIKQVNDITIDNMKGYEIIADGTTKTGGTSLVYQVMLFYEKGQYYAVFGEAATEFDKNLAAFRKIAGTFKRK